jgi:hypothetical protein
VAESPPISERVRNAIREKFAGDDATRVEAALLSYGGEVHHREADRVRMGIVAESRDVANVERLVALAKRDYRDAIMETEYGLKDGKLMRLRSFIPHE